VRVFVCVLACVCQENDLVVYDSAPLLCKLSLVRALSLSLLQSLSLDLDLDLSLACACTCLSVSVSVHTHACVFVCVAQVATLQATHAILTELHVTQFDDECTKTLADALAGAHAVPLQALALNDTCLSNIWAAALAQMLMMNTKLRLLTLRDVNITDHGGVIIGQALMKNTTMIAINLFSTEMSMKQQTSALFSLLDGIGRPGSASSTHPPPLFIPLGEQLTHDVSVRDGVACHRDGMVDNGKGGTIPFALRCWLTRLCATWISNIWALCLVTTIECWCHLGYL